MSAIGKGDWVECVSCGDDDSDDLWIFDDHYPEIGGVYRVDGIEPFDGGLYLGGFDQIDPDHGERVSWEPEHFRPIYRESQQIIESLKQPVPALEREEEWA